MTATPQRLTRISKYLSLHLRHRPEALGLTLEPGGWVSVDTLIRAAASKGFAFSRDELDRVMADNDKQRFAFDDDRTRIRANQGHSVEVDLELQPTAPPKILYHGTGEKTVPTIVREGLRKMRRHHVHLSSNPDTARTVGARHGRPVVFDIDAARMARDGHTFYRSENGVWLVEQVPSEYLTRRTSEIAKQEPGAR
jgi:putative RNA 2'-phosphotransferase